MPSAVLARPALLQSALVLAGLSAAGALLHPANLPARAATDRPPTVVDAGAQDPAWSPDGTRLAFTLFERLHVATTSGQVAGPLTAWDADVPVVVEREPAWSPDGQRIVFAADLGRGFDLYVVAATGGRPEPITFLPGDARWPSWSADGRVVFAARERGQWDLYLVDPDARTAMAPPTLQRLTDSLDDETEPAVSPDGRRVAFVSARDSEDGEADLWVMDLPRRDEAWTATGDAAVRVVAAGGTESRPAWSPDGRRLAFAALRARVGSIWVTEVEPSSWIDDPPARPAALPVLVARTFGVATWSPDGESLVVASLPDPESGYGGNPRRDSGETPPAFRGAGAFALRRMPAPRPPDRDWQPVALSREGAEPPWRGLFDRTWTLLRDLYFREGPSAAEWRRLGDRYRPQAMVAPDVAALEDRVDEMIAAQPLVRPAVSSRRAIIVSGHRLASEIGARVLAAGGNVVDAAVAASFAVGVVEPDASGIGGDGMAIVWLTSMDQPVVVDFKDQSPRSATLENPRIFRDRRLVAEGPAAANIPGVVAGMQLLHARYGSGRVSWLDVVAPAAALAADGFVLDASLPASLAAGRSRLARSAEAARVFLPGGRLPRPGDRFVNPDLAATLRTIASEGAEAFYRGSIARRIAEDMAATGGLITLEDLEQYRAIERAPVSGQFRGHRVYSAPPPVASGTALIATLQVLDRYGVSGRTSYARDAEYWHYMIEAWKLREPVTRVADPALWPVDLEPHLSSDEAARVFHRIDARRAGSFPAAFDEDPATGPADGIGRGTTAIVVADVAGNAIAVTQTLSAWGGSFHVSKGLGFLYNNHLRGYRTEPGSYGQLLPRMRSSSAAVPTLVFEERAAARRPILALAVAGDAWIAPTAYGIVSSVIDGSLPMQQAIEAPRFLVARDPADATGRRARVEIEDRFPRPLLETLSARGHVFHKIGRKGELKYGYAAAVRIDSRAGAVEAGADPRRSYVAATP